MWSCSLRDSLTSPEMTAAPSAHSRRFGTTPKACRLMGQLCGVLMYHTAKYVNENLHRYTPKRELEAELHRKSAVTESTSEDSRHA